MLEALSTLHVFLLMGALRMTLELRVVIASSQPLISG
jgi:hypothetical protein